MFYFVLVAILVTVCFMQHGSNTNRDLGWIFDDLRRDALWSLEDEAEKAKNTLNYLRYYRG